MEYKKNNKILSSDNKLFYYKNKVYELEKKVKSLENKIKKMKIEIKEKERIISEEKSKNENLNESKNKSKNGLNNISQKNKILELENEIKILKTYFLSPGEKLITVKFISVKQNINFTVTAKNTDHFTKIKEKLYQNFPGLKNTENYFYVNEKKINENETLEENKIKNNDILTLNQNEDK